MRYIANLPIHPGTKGQLYDRHAASTRDLGHGADRHKKGPDGAPAWAWSRIPIPILLRGRAAVRWSLRPLRL